ncbi:hypothetical protein P3X46_009828 [Hevea brasiliensis]|uniref:Nicalin n=1 Tax=Hevea brasiliensis TaxID=3981 RepID=A0ABQ9MEW0_HEVBR|nr:hypothetical protein P3X46_009828 [Hevea brasiliensis]
MFPFKSRQPQMLDSMYSMIALVFILVACVELCDAATVVDVYRLIQYDISGVPFGSRLATLNHHAGSLHFTPGADLSRTVVIIPIRELNITFVKEYITQRKPLGGLLFLLPQIFDFEDRGATVSEDQVHEKGLMKTVLAELEKLLIHANIPYPVYFAFENDDIDTVLSDIKRNDATGQPATATTGGYKFVVSAPEPKRIASPTITNIQVAWEHEQFSRLRITAATLSELSVAPDILESTGGLSDNRYFVNETAIVRSIKLVAESIARHIYSHQGENIKVFADDSSLAVNPSYVKSWLDLLSQTPRVAPFLSKNDPFVMALKKELEDHAHEVNVQHEALDGMFTFYDSTKAKLNIYQVASVTFDLLLLLVLGSYLIVLFSFLVITTRGLDDLISLFRRPTSRKVKTA